ncbi:MAG: hypothetical protein ACD_51C00291G0001, partial [uncultured bacterium]
MQAEGSTLVGTKTLDMDGNVQEVEVCVDAGDDVAELDEENNCMTVTYGADLAVTDVYLGVYGTVTYEVSNLGDTDVDPATEGNNSVYVNDESFWRNSWATLNDKTFMEAGGSTTIGTKPLEGTGVQEVEVCVDAGNDVEEVNEENNCMTVTYGPDLYVVDIYMGENGRISYDVGNQGNFDIDAALNGDMELYVDDAEDPMYSYNWLTLSN